MSLYKNKYRIESTRLRNWDYARSANYFVTICTKNRYKWFGEIIVDMQCIAYLRPSKIGSIVQNEWLKTPAIRPDMNLLLDAFIVMPNHFHAIICIGDNEYNRDRDGDRDAMHGVSAITTAANHFGPQSKNLGSVMRGFKSSVTTQARKLNQDFGWQEQYHDHIIRDDASYNRIRNYILNNPKNWKDDKFFNA